jgi:ATP-dependent exoDNAse (exonuclease V) beta subunit
MSAMGAGRADDHDGPARRRIAEELDTNLMVVAGAGTGKTTALVGRIVALVRSGAVPLGRIAAITFTEAAADELRQQVRRAVEASAAEDATMAAARDEVDDAAICTLHSFAQRILVEQCVEAGLPPGFDVLDDAADAADFDLHWNRFADTLLQDPDAERALVLGFSLGLRPTDLATVARSLRAHWDRLEDGGLEHLRAAPVCDDGWPRTDPSVVIEALDAARACARWCTTDEDNLVVHLRATLTEASALLTAAGDDELAVLHLLDTLPPFRCAQGRQENWTGRVAEVRAACAEAEQIRLDLVDGVRRAVLGDLLVRLATFTLASAEERREEGRLTFHDLLVHARRLVRRGGPGLVGLSRRYRRVLIDEFQDTDPIQVELAARLVSAVDGGADVGAAHPGALFVVGDPKQSIYRFRRADIELFEGVGATIGPPVVLETNFRSVPGIVDFVNVVFRAVFGDGTVPGQAAHHDLHAARPVPRGSGSGSTATAATGAAGRPAPARQLTFDGFEALEPRHRPPKARPPAPAGSPAAVATVGGAIAGSTPEVRRQSAGDAAAALHRIVDEGWPVEDAAQAMRRPVRWGDIAVLIPARSSLPALEDSLENAAIPYRLEGAALLWGCREVRDTLVVLRAVDDPADAVATLGALRSPGLACGDDDLVTWHGAGGTWDPGAPPPPGLECHPVALALAVLDRLHHRRWWSEPSALVGAAYDELRSFALAFSSPRPREHWHRLRWLQDQARLFDESCGGTLRAFLAWADLRSRGDGRVGGVGPPDPDDDAVRVMTIHGAKGLEFPVVVLAGLERDQTDGPPVPAVVWTEDHVPEVHVGRFRTAGFEQAGLREQRLDVLEQHRLLYVAMTRARDHLVLCLHHRLRSGGPDTSLAALVTRICSENRPLWRTLPGGGAAPERAVTGPGHGGDRSHANGSVRRAGPVDRAGDGEALARWEAERRRTLTAGRRAPVTTATAIARHVDDRGGDRAGDIGTPGHRGSPSSAIVEAGYADVPRRMGRAVHAALADVDLSTGCDAAGRPAAEVARRRALDHGVVARAPDVEMMVRRALSSPTVRNASDRRHWHEVSVTSPVGDVGVLEGVVDLLFEGDTGLVVVDYKTDGVDHRDAVLVTHRLQVAAYAVALEASTGLDVTRCVLLFVGTGEPWEFVLEGEELAVARAEARRVADDLVAR